ncbi:MAG: hypothetical protein JXB47_21475 [Anaerolineae bacterium]|nr:hypothetical protein [Anaerolineae bacterium]
MASRETYAKLEQWAGRLEASGLGHVLSVLFRAFGPLAPVGAGVLWAAQPALGLLVDRDAVGEWAALLEDPEALAWLGARLAAEEADDRE